jgi:hypothetical protein
MVRNRWQPVDQADGLGTARFVVMLSVVEGSFGPGHSSAYASTVIVPGILAACTIT